MNKNYYSICKYRSKYIYIYIRDTLLDTKVYEMKLFFIINCMKCKNFVKFCPS